MQDSKRRRLSEEEYRRVRRVARWADWGEEAAHRFGILKADLRKKVNLIDDMDIAISSIALNLGGLATLRQTRS